MCLFSNNPRQQNEAYTCRYLSTFVVFFYPMTRTRFGPWIWIGRRFGIVDVHHRPLASQVLTAHLRQSRYPYWTAFFIPYRSILNDQFGWSHFNWSVDGHNYHILRIGCWPYIKYHCSRRPLEDLYIQNVFYTWIKCLQFGIPTLAYGITGWMMAKHHEDVHINSTKSIRIYFWYKENRDLPY